MNDPNKLECYITLGWKRLAVYKHFDLLRPFVSEEENEVLWIRSQVQYSQHFFVFITYEWSQ